MAYEQYKHSNIITKPINFNYDGLIGELYAELDKLPYARKNRLYRLIKYIYIAGLCEEKDVSVIQPYYDTLHDCIVEECDVLEVAKKLLD